VTSKTTYQSYLLRLWRDSPQGAWYASVQSTASGEKQIFPDLAALFDFLLTAGPAEDGDDNADECGSRPLTAVSGSSQ